MATITAAGATNVAIFVTIALKYKPIVPKAPKLAPPVTAKAIAAIKKDSTSFASMFRRPTIIPTITNITPIISVYADM